jgi:aspartyl-tRNA(Asn)/glutamyl-tRNA(Gln) amidotransferase subunit C
MPLDDRELANLEDLAALRLEPEERRALRAHLETILAYVDQLRSIDTSGVPPTSYPVERPTALREDEPVACLPADVALDQAPARAGDHFEVPPVLSSDEGAPPS